MPMFPVGYLSVRALLCRGEQLLLRFFGEGSRQLKLIRASLAIQGAEQNGRPFSKLQIKRRGQREKVAISNRLPRFRIRACSAPFRFGPEQFVIPVFGEPGRREDYALLIPSQSRVSCRGKYFFLNSRTVHLPSEDVSGRDCWFVAQNRRVSRFSAGLHLYQCMLEVGFV